MKFIPLVVSIFTVYELFNSCQLVSSQVLTDDRHGTFVGPPISPTKKPTKFPSFKLFNPSPTKIPSRSQPTIKPSWRRKTHIPTVRKSVKPTTKQTKRPSLKVTAIPSIKKSNRPSFRRSVKPTRKPTVKVTLSPSRRISRKPSIRKSVLPSMKPTRRVTASPSRRFSKTPTFRKTTKPSKKPSLKVTTSPSKKVSKIPSRRPTRRPSRRPTPRVTNLSRRPSKRPTSSKIFSQKPSIRRSKAPSLKSSFASSTPDICESNTTGTFGIATSNSIVVSYGYQMQMSPTADTAGLANKMELAISNIVWPSISSCSNSTTRLLQSSSPIKVSGLSYLPKDKVSDCASVKKDSKCISVDGIMTVYITEKSILRSRSLSSKRYTLNLSQATTDISTSINQIIDNGMRTGQFLSVSSDIQGVTYVGPVIGQQRNESNRFPAYGYAIIVLLIAAIAATTLAALKYIQKRSSKSKEEVKVDDLEVISPNVSNSIRSKKTKVLFRTPDDLEVESSKNDITGDESKENSPRYICGCS